MAQATAVDDSNGMFSPRERTLERGAMILRYGAFANAGLAGVALLIGILAALKVIPSITQMVHSVLLSGYVGVSDIALAIIVIGTMLNFSLFLVISIGVRAREIWALPMLVLFGVVNVMALVTLGFVLALVTLAFLVWALFILRSDFAAFRVNPVMLKELRGRMRGVRAFVVMSVFLALMSAFTVLIYFTMFNARQYNAFSGITGDIGRTLFFSIVGLEMLLIFFIAPSFTAGAITGERERQTYELLRTTLLPQPSFVIGKLESALGYILLLLLSAIPLQSIAFLFGGVSELEVILSFVILIVLAITLGAAGMYYSAVKPRTLAASVSTYTGAIVLAVIIPLLVLLVGGLILSLLVTNRTMMDARLEGLISYVQLFLTSLNPVTTAIDTYDHLINRQVVTFWTRTLSDGSTIPMVSAWLSYTVIYLAVSALLVTLAIRKVRQQAEQD